MLHGTSVDELNAYLYDSAFNHLVDAWINAMSTGTITWDLTGASFLGDYVGLEFDFNSLPGDWNYDSYVTISNVRMEVVPEPCTMVLLGSGLAGLAGLARKRLGKSL